MLDSLLLSPYRFFNKYELNRDNSFYYILVNTIQFMIAGYIVGYSVGIQ